MKRVIATILILLLLISCAQSITSNNSAEEADNLELEATEQLDAILAEENMGYDVYIEGHGWASRVKSHLNVTLVDNDRMVKTEFELQRGKGKATLSRVKTSNIERAYIQPEYDVDRLDFFSGFLREFIEKERDIFSASEALKYLTPESE